jgi:hypothetical protein
MIGRDVRGQRDAIQHSNEASVEVEVHGAKYHYSPLPYFLSSSLSSFTLFLIHFE